MTGFYLVQIFTEKFFPNKLWKKSTRKLSSWKEILSWMIWNFSVIQQKMPWLIWVYIGSFSVYISHFFDITKTGIDEIVNFGNLRKLFTNKCTTFYGILAPHLQIVKTKHSDMANETWCNDRPLYIGEVNVRM